MDLRKQTELLKEHLASLKEIFEKNSPPESTKDRDFFLMVKKDTDPIYQLLEEWEETALSVVKERKANVHPQQITSTRENMELVLMHSYYVDTRRKRYMELHNSILYVFDLLLEDI
ncbi:YppE family protein [Oceanobacillus damuensis]|uniref:YppE family protein n=1 Tax=Oceanobacillus damuensis TaxID=937928 RepID=UPI00082BECEF|nr:YppE family protein [Oceanobacillus damuensis]